MAKVTVIGGGIVGASISLNLAKAGCQVTVVESALAPAPASTATARSWAWLNAINKQPRHYRDLNLAGLRLWHTDPEWSCLLPAPAHAAAGALLLGDAAAQVHAGHAQLQSQGGSQGADSDYAPCLLRPDELAALEPGLAEGACTCGGVLYSEDAWVDPAAATQALLARAQALGARVLLGTRVLQLVLEQQQQQDVFSVGSAAAAAGGQHDKQARLGKQAQRVAGVLTSPSPTSDGSPPDSSSISSLSLLTSDWVVLAAGTASPGLLAGTGLVLPLLHKPAIVATTTAIGERLMRHMLYDGHTWVWQRPDGSCMLGDSGEGEEASEAAGAALLAHAACMLPGLAHARVEEVAVGYRPWPQDGHPIIGAMPGVDGLYAAIMHSGMTLAPHVGQLVAAEVSHGQMQQAWLGPYRPGRDMQQGQGQAAYAWKGKASVHGSKP